MAEEDPRAVLSTKLGQLKGLARTSAGPLKKTYYSFQGIPYAKPPIGNLRFKPPQPFGKWEGVRDATKEGNDTAQKHMLFNYPVGDEDCLYLNVYTTQPGDESAKKAVMVWIHGGGFTRGSGSSEIYGPDYLIENDVVFVAINYRCGVLGFLSLQNDVVPGNNGLKDQNLALRWVQENISSFGGDPNNVTIFGQSAGGASVHYHLLSPLSRGLFHKAILQSGFSVCQWAFQQDPLSRVFQLAEELGCSSRDPDTILEFLKTIPATALVQAQDKVELISAKEKIHKFSLLFMPCVEVTGTAPFLTDSPKKLMEGGEFYDVPMIIGVTDKEGMLSLALKEIDCDAVNKDPSLFVPSDLKLHAPAEDHLKLGRDILQFYTKKAAISWDDRDTILGYIDFITDIGFANGLDFSRKYFLKHKKAAVYQYLFTYTSPRGFSSFLLPMSYPERGPQYVGCGASHGDELIHQFKTNMAQAPAPPPSPEDQQFMDKFVLTWTTFSKTGNPNWSGLGVTWQADSSHNPHHLTLNQTWQPTDTIIFPQRMEFWKKLYEKYSYAY